MALFDGNTVKSKIPYTFALSEEHLENNLATLFFKERRKFQNNDQNHVNILDARNPQNRLMSQELERQTQKLAKSLYKNGFRKGDCLQIMMQNNVDFFTPALAAWTCGGSASIVNPNISVKSLADQLKLTKIKVIFSFPKFFQIIKEAVELIDTKTIIVILDQIEPENQDWSRKDNDKYRSVSWSEFLEEGQHECEIQAKNFDKNDHALIFWSSGTTGTPKGIIYHFDMIARQILFEKTSFAIPLEPTKIGHFILTTNFFHAGGFWFSLINGLRNGNTVIVFTTKDENNTISARELQLACHEYKVV